MLFPKAKRIEDRDYLDFVKSLPCCVGVECAGEIDPSHILTRGSRHGHDIPGFVVSHCRLHHNQFERDRALFLETYPHFVALLRGWGWVWGDDAPNGKLWHPLLGRPYSELVTYANTWKELMGL